MPILIGPSASPYIAATITLSASTNYNQNSGVVNSTINTTGNRDITSVEFQLSTTSDFSSGNTSWIAASTNTTITQGSTNTVRSASPTGLANDTTYYVRCRTTNSSGLITTSSIGSSFKTYKQNTVTFTGSSTWTNPRTTSGTSGLAITSITDVIAVGGGSIQIVGGGGGGGYETASSLSCGSSVVVTIGAGGVYFQSGATNTTVAASTTLTAYAGSPGYFDGGASGNGFAGGAGDRTSPNYDAGGGGGGAGGVGSPYNPSARTGGNGGPGVNGFGVGGGGYGQNGDGTPSGNGPANSGQGAGGSGTAGGSGYAQFKYWGP
jgi:hypothetical protein